jgi:hypothetical protein
MKNSVSEQSWNGLCSLTGHPLYIIDLLNKSKLQSFINNRHIASLYLLLPVSFIRPLKYKSMCYKHYFKILCFKNNNTGSLLCVAYIAGHITDSSAWRLWHSHLTLWCWATHKGVTEHFSKFWVEFAHSELKFGSFCFAAGALKFSLYICACLSPPPFYTF